MGARGGSIDLVGEHDIGKDGARPKFKFLRLLVEVEDARYVRGEEVGRKLDALEGAVQGASQGLCQGGLSNAGNVLHEDMPLT